MSDDLEYSRPPPGGREMLKRLSRLSIGWHGCLLNVRKHAIAHRLGDAWNRCGDPAVNRSASGFSMRGGLYLGTNARVRGHR
jgi:hypothetical protein